MSQRGSIDDLAVGLAYFSGQGRAYVGRWPQVSPKDQLVIWECRDIVPEHNPIIPREFADVADVGSAAGHSGLRDFTIGHVDVIASVRADEGFQLYAVVP